MSIHHSLEAQLLAVFGHLGYDIIQWSLDYDPSQGYFEVWGIGMPGVHPGEPFIGIPKLLEPKIVQFFKGLGFEARKFRIRIEPYDGLNFKITLVAESK